MDSLAGRAYYEGSLNRESPFQRARNRFERDGTPIPDHVLPGRAIMALPAEQRAMLATLRSEDIANVRPPPCYPPHNPFTIWRV